MTENSAEGRNSTTTTTVLDGKNGSVHKPKLTKSVSEDLKTTFSSPIAWLLVAALVITWSAVAIVMFDLVDYKTLAGGSLNKFRTEPVKVIHEAVDDTTDWLYSIFTTISDIINIDEEHAGHGEPPVKKIVAIQPSAHRKAQKEKPEHIDVKAAHKVFYKEKPVKEEKVEKVRHKVIHKERPEVKEKAEKKHPAKAVKKEKPETKGEPKKKTPAKVSQKEKPEPKAKPEKAPSKVIAKQKPEKKEKAEKKSPPKAEKKSKVSQVEEKPKKEVKAKTSEAKVTKETKKEVKAAEESKKKPKTKEIQLEKTEKAEKQGKKESAPSPLSLGKAAIPHPPAVKAEEQKKKSTEKKKDSPAPKKAGLR